MIAFTPRYNNPYLGNPNPYAITSATCDIVKHGSSGWIGFDTGSVEGSWTTYGTCLHRGIEAKDIAELYGVLQVCLIEDRAARKFAKVTERKEGREASRKGWYRKPNNLCCQVVSRSPEWPFRLMLGGANR